MERIRSALFEERTVPAGTAENSAPPAAPLFSDRIWGDDGGPAERPKRVAIVQSNYLPWIGYFDLIASVDEFIFYDDVQYTTRDWRNRNRIKTPQGVQWLTVPVTGDRRSPICDVAIGDPALGRKHWKILNANYRRARAFESTRSWLQPLFDEPWTSISAVNQHLIQAICGGMNIRTKLTRSSDYPSTGDRNQRLISLCRQAGADVYVSGPRAASYVDVDAFAREGLQIEWMRYGDYPAYPQLWGDYAPDLSIVDLLFNCGAEGAAALIRQAT